MLSGQSLPSTPADADEWPAFQTMLSHLCILSVGRRGTENRQSAGGNQAKTDEKPNKRLLLGCLLQGTQLPYPVIAVEGYPAGTWDTPLTIFRVFRREEGSQLRAASKSPLDGVTDWHNFGGTPPLPDRHHCRQDVRIARFLHQVLIYLSKNARLPRSPWGLEDNDGAFGRSWLGPRT